MQHNAKQRSQQHIHQSVALGQVVGNTNDIATDGVKIPLHGAAYRHGAIGELVFTGRNKAIGAVGKHNSGTDDSAGQEAPVGGIGFVVLDLGKDQHCHCQRQVV